MRLKSITILIISFLFIFLSSTAIYSQSKKLRGEWLLQSLTENGNDIPLVALQPIEEEAFARLRLTRDSFSIKPACNIKSGKYTTTKPGRLKFTALRTTVMGCRRETQAFDSSFVAALSKAVKYRIKGKILTLQDAGGRNVLVFQHSSSLK